MIMIPCATNQEMCVEDLPLPGLKKITCKQVVDERGKFVKTFHESLLAKYGILHSAKEEFYSSTRKGVIRGMHFQVPPHDHTKLVYCACGRVIDVILDLRRSSPTYGKSHGVVLEANQPAALFIPRGMAHGFQSLADDSLVFYSVSTVHHPESDQGIRWDSFGFPWPEPVAGVSERDRNHPAYADWNSPFA